MTKKQRVILICIVAVLAILFTLTAQSTDTPQSEKNEAVTVWQLMDKMDSLRTLKEECVNNLNIADSARFLRGETGYCDSRDAEITELRDQISVMSKKDYEGLR